MPIGIFLFSLKSEFQKSEENGEKRRKPEKISGFSVGIFFVKTHSIWIPESRLWREYSRPASGEQAPRPSGGVCGPDSARGRAEPETLKGGRLQKEQARDRVPVLFEEC